MRSSLTLDDRSSKLSTLKIKHNPDDYFHVYSDGTTLVEIQGRRPFQEDVLTFEYLEGFDQLSQTQQAEALESTFRISQERVADISVAGSTACVAIAWIDESNCLHAQCANVGDSEAYLIIRELNQAHQLFRLNKKIHSTSNEDEQKRLSKIHEEEEKNGNVSDRHVIIKSKKRGDRLGGKLDMTRAMGDKDLLTDSSDHAPDIDTYSIPLTKYQTAYLLVACDGLFESRKHADDEKTSKASMLRRYFENIFERNFSLPLAIMYLVNAAYQSHSKDNISVGFSKIKKGPPISLAVFDGHGNIELDNDKNPLATYGTLVSSSLGYYFYQTLINEIADCTLGKEESSNETNPSELDRHSPALGFF